MYLLSCWYFVSFFCFPFSLFCFCFLFSFLFGDCHKSKTFLMISFPFQCDLWHITKTWIFFDIVIHYDIGVGSCCHAYYYELIEGATWWSINKFWLLGFTNACDIVSNLTRHVVEFCFRNQVLKDGIYNKMNNQREANTVSHIKGQ